MDGDYSNFGIMQPISSSHKFKLSSAISIFVFLARRERSAAVEPGFGALGSHSAFSSAEHAYVKKSK